MNEKKDSNPKDALGIKKVPLHAVPVKPLLEVGLAMMEGGRKYGTHNYREVGVCMSTYYDATMRHLMSWWEGEDIDPASGIHHIVKALASLFVVRDGMHMGNCVDDRPIRYPDGIDIEKFNKIAADLITKYPECEKPFTYHKSASADEIDRPEPKFKAGDEVHIRLHSNAGSCLKKICQDNSNTGIYIEAFGKKHYVQVEDDKYWFFNDELTLAEDN